jgi:hypothetical protein
MPALEEYLRHYAFTNDRGRLQIAYVHTASILTPSVAIHQLRTTCNTEEMANRLVARICANDYIFIRRAYANVLVEFVITGHLPTYLETYQMFVVILTEADTEYKFELATEMHALLPEHKRCLSKPTNTRTRTLLRFRDYILREPSNYRWTAERKSKFMMLYCY